MRFLKQLLGLQIQTTNSGVYLDTGRIPLTLYAKHNYIKNWDRIAIKKRCNSLLYTSYANMYENNNQWINQLKSCLSEVELGSLIQGEQPSPHKICLRKAKLVFHQNAFAEINNPSSKLRTYALIKLTIGREPYLSDLRNVKDRIAFTKFRLSNH